MMKLGAVMLLAAPLVQPAGDTLTGSVDARVQTIRKVEGEKDWPFVDDEGLLACIPTFGQNLIIFRPTSSESRKGEVALDVNPVGMVTQYIGRKDVFLPVKSPEELIERIAPFVAMGKMLCKYKDGPVVPGSEL